MTSLHAHSELEDLAETLWNERHIVEYLLFKLVTAKLILASDERRFVTPALDEVERILGVLRDTEARRAMAVAAVASAWGTPEDDLSLAELTKRAPEPMRQVFREHRDAFTTLASEIEETAAANRELASATLGHVRQSIDALTGPQQAATYTANGRHDTPVTTATRLDRVL
jgi:hypothetical protein